MHIGLRKVNPGKIKPKRFGFGLVGIRDFGFGLDLYNIFQWLYGWQPAQAPVLQSKKSKMSQCFISSNQESLISSKLLTKQQEEKRKDRENVNRDYRYLLLLVQKRRFLHVYFCIHI